MYSRKDVVIISIFCSFESSCCCYRISGIIASSATVFAQQQQSNSLEANKEKVKSFVEVFNKHNVTAVDKYYALTLFSIILWLDKDKKDSNNTSGHYSQLFHISMQP